MKERDTNGGVGQNVGYALCSGGGVTRRRARGGGWNGGGEAWGRLGELARRTGGEGGRRGCERVKAARRGQGAWGGVGLGSARDPTAASLSKWGAGLRFLKENVYSLYNRVMDGAVPWRETWDTCTAPLSATFRANDTARNYSYVQLKSSTLYCTTAQWRTYSANSALDQGREVFAVPAGIFSPGSGGVNKLIQDGAHPVTDVNDILESLNLHMLPQQSEAQILLPANDEERTLLKLLSSDPQHIDDLTRISELPAQLVSSTLTVMELKGFVRHLGGMQYALTR